MSNDSRAFQSLPPPVVPFSLLPPAPSHAPQCVCDGRCVTLLKKRRGSEPHGWERGEGWEAAEGALTQYLMEEKEGGKRGGGGVENGGDGEEGRREVRLHGGE